jgi:hypothetical protein
MTYMKCINPTKSLIRGATYRVIQDYGKTIKVLGSYFKNVTVSKERFEVI